MQIRTLAIASYTLLALTLLTACHPGTYYPFGENPAAKNCGPGEQNVSPYYSSEGSNEKYKKPVVGF